MSELEDRISNLPASILNHILSFVPTHVAARTSVLSKRWKYIWRSIPNLQFRCGKSSRVQKFMCFVDTTLELHDDSNIKRFSLYSDLHLNKSKIENWISILISHNVEELSLQLNQRDTVLIRSPLYACESLVGLTLVSRLKICFPKYISFPRLKSLTLLRVKFRDECWNEELFSNCPVLEFLCMGCCTWSGMKNFCISNPALKHLMIINTEDSFQNCALKIRAPSLESLIYRGMVAKDYTLSSFPTLGRACIDLLFEEYGAMIDCGAVVSKFLRATAYVVHLTISDQTLQVISVADDLLNNLPSYNNLKELCLTREVTADKALIALLERAPNLVSLEFERPDYDDDDASDDGSEDNYYNDAAEGEDYCDNEDYSLGLDTVAARCSFLHLKLVSFNKFTGDAREMRWLKLILNNANALETMTISCERISNMKRENLMADIPSLPRASASCMFKFSPKQG